MRQQLRRGRQGGAARGPLGSGGRQFVQAANVAQVLFEQRVEMLGGQGLEKGVQAAGQGGAREAGGRRALFEGELAKRVGRFQPVPGYAA